MKIQNMYFVFKPVGAPLRLSEFQISLHHLMRILKGANYNYY